MTHAWHNWRYLVLNGKIRTRGILFPRRERVLIRRVLQRIGVRYKEIIPVWNPYHTGFRDNQNGTVQWLDFIIQLPNKKIAAILFTGHVGGGDKPYEKRGMEAKQRLLTEKGIPFVIFPRYYSAQEYEIRIRIFINERRYYENTRK